MRNHRLFIGHSWSHSDLYDRLIRLLGQRGYFSFTDYSVPRNDPIHNAPTVARLRQAIRNKMSPCSVVIVMAGVYATYSKWIDEEIDLAKNSFRVSKPIVAIEPWGSKHTSVRVKEAADRIVGWNTESVVRAVREFA